MTNPLLNENCVYVEWTTGDGGQHIFTPTWWVDTPDINITAPQLGVATVGPDPLNPVVNTVRCHPHAVANCLDPNADVLVQAFVAIPATAMGPNNTEKIGEVAVAALTLGPQGTATTISWKPNGKGAQTLGHRCLVVRVFPDTFTPSSTSFFLEQAERHVAQHNIEIVKAVNIVGEVPGPDEIPPAENGLWEVPVGFVNLFEEDARIGLVIDQDPRPHKELIAVIRPLLEAVPGFERFDDTIVRTEIAFPPGIEVEPWDDPRAGDDDDDDHHGDKRGRRMRREQLRRRKWQNLHSVTARLPGGFTDRFTLSLDLRDTPRGLTKVLHVQQSDRRGRPQGGLTVVVVRGE
jgi:hypothetical protein